MPLVIFLASILIVPGFVGLATSPRWTLLAAVVPFIWYFTPGRLTVGHLLGALLLTWCTFTLAWTFSFNLALYEFGKMGLLGLLFCIGAGQQDLKSIYIAAALGATVNSVLIVGQYFFPDFLLFVLHPVKDGVIIDIPVHMRDFIPQATMPAGTFYNKNFAAEFAALALVGILGVPRWRWLALGVLPGVMLCQSRTALLGLGAAMVLLIWQKNKSVAALLGVMLSGTAAYIAATGYTLAQRFQLWHDTIAGMTFWGRGIGSFWSTYPEHATQIDGLALRPSEAHNDLLQAVYELGPGSLVLVALLAFAWRGPKRTEHYVLLVFLVEGLAGFPLHMPATAMLAALVVGCLCGDRVERSCAPVGRGSIGLPVPTNSYERSSVAVA